MVSNGYTSKCSGLTHHFRFFDIWHCDAQDWKIQNGGGLDQYGAKRFGGIILPQSEKVWD